MQEKQLTVSYKVCTFGELSDADQQLVQAAQEATAHSYAPYSGFHVGAAVRLCNGSVISGSNQENAAFPAGTCAERTAIFYANSQFPDEAVEAIAIAARGTDGLFTSAPISPCGVCRQVLIETQKRGGIPLRIVLFGQNEIHVLETVSDLLPFQFDSF